MDSILKRLVGVSVVTLMLAAGPAFAQADGAADAPAAEAEAPADVAPETTEAPAEGVEADATAIPEGPSAEVQAQIDALDPEVDQHLWCASAFALIASVSQNPAEVEGLTQLSQGLIATAREALPEADYPEADFQAISAGYNLIVIGQFDAGDETAMPYSPEQCFEIAEGMAGAPAGEAPAGEAAPADGAAAPAGEPTSEADAVEAAEDDAAAEEPNPSGGGEEDELLGIEP